MALYGRDYDRHFGYGTPRAGWGGDRDPWGRSHGQMGATRWDRAFNRGYDWGMIDRYGRDYGWGAHDRASKGRWQTDYGDPFGDRQHHTPMRAYRTGERDNRAWETLYDREYDAAPYPFGYRPYAERMGYDDAYRPRFRGRGYRDTSWF